MAKIKVLEKRSNETGPLVWQKSECGRCFVCRGPIGHGQEYYSIITSKFDMRRHITCACSPVKESSEVPPLGSAKRRQAGGHGYSGGDGFIDL